MPSEPSRKDTVVVNNAAAAAAAALQLFHCCIVVPQLLVLLLFRTESLSVERGTVRYVRQTFDGFDGFTDSASYYTVFNLGITPRCRFTRRGTYFVVESIFGVLVNFGCHVFDSGPQIALVRWSS